MPYVVTANCIVCKDLEGAHTAAETIGHGGVAQRPAEATPRLPEHLRQPGDGSRRATKKPETDDPASG